MLNTHRHTNHIRCHACCDQILIVHLAMGGGCGVKHTGMSICHMGSDHSHLQACHEFLCACSAALHAEGDHTAGTVRHILLCDLVILITGQSCKLHPSDLGMTRMADVIGKAVEDALGGNK